MSCPKVDLHIHPKHAGCANKEMELPVIIQACHAAGNTAIGITDHLNRPEQLSLHKDIRKELLEFEEPPVDIYFGVELNFTGCDQDFVFSPEIKEEYQFQFAIGGIHSTYLDEYDIVKLVEIQHRHHIKTCMNPLVDVLVHPYWFGKKGFETKGFPWFDTMKVVPESMTRELAQVAKDTDTAIEINVNANLICPNFPDSYHQEYMQYLAILAEEGVTFSVATDAHAVKHLYDIHVAWEAIETLGVPAERVWMPKTEPLVKRKQ